MRVVVQRVSRADVEIDGAVHAAIGPGLLLLVGVTRDDVEADAGWLAGKIVRMRLFDDENGVMNRSVQDIGGEVLAVSQFTLHAATRKGNRPSHIAAAPQEIAAPLYNTFLEILSRLLGKPVQSGRFGAHMNVSLTNDGPVTILLDSKNRE